MIIVLIHQSPASTTVSAKQAMRAGKNSTIDGVLDSTMQCAVAVKYGVEPGHISCNYLLPCDNTIHLKTRVNDWKTDQG